MKAIDIILPPAKTEKEDWKRFLNRIETELRIGIYRHKVKIVVK